MFFSGPKGQSAVISSATIGNVALVETNRPSASANSSNLTEKDYGVKNVSLNPAHSTMGTTEAL